VSFCDVDDEQYVCTQFAPYYANRVLPCFDQPDLKATMLLNVLTPALWERVISNEHPKLHCTAFTLEAYLQNTRTQHQELLINMMSKHEGNMSMFHKTPLLPTYLYCFVSGAYKQFPL
jgi:aminopeptidase N